MKSTFLYILSFLLTFDTFGQNISQSVLPMEQDIVVKIISIDTILLDLYDIYKFEYNNDIRIVKGEFWVRTNDTILETGKTSVSLCKINQMQGGIRGFRNDGLSIYEDSVLIRYFNFDEGAESPFLRLCSTD